MDSPVRVWRIAVFAAFLLGLAGVVVAADRGLLPGFLRRVYAFPGGDKAGHFFMMGALAWLAVRAFPGRRPGRIPAVAWPLVVLVAGEELSQAAFPTRTLSALDLTASLAGVGAGLGLGMRRAGKEGSLVPDAIQNQGRSADATPEPCRAYPQPGSS